MSVLKRWGTATCYLKNAEVQQYFDGNILENPKRPFKGFLLQKEIDMNTLLAALHSISF